MSGRTRPIEKFARAVAKCSSEVIDDSFPNLGGSTELNQLVGLSIWQMYSGRLQRCIQEYMPYRIPQAQRLLSRTLIS